MRWTVQTLAALGLTVFMAGSGEATPTYVQYTLTSTASGKLGNDTFTDMSVSIVGIADASQIVSPSPGIFNLPLIANSLFIGSFPTESFEIADIQMGVNQGTAEAGFVFGQSESLLLGIGNGGLSSYDLSVPAGPFNGQTLFVPGQILATTAGELVFSSFSDSITLTASAGPSPLVPEPSSLALFGLGAVCAGAYASRKARA